MAARRTTHRSSTGTKLYAKRGRSGKFTDIQVYARAHAADLRRTSKDELAAAGPATRTAGKKTARKATKKTAGMAPAGTAKKTARKAVKKTTSRAARKRSS